MSIRPALREFTVTAAPVVAVVGIVFFLFLRYVQPAPPKTVVIAAGQNEASLRYHVTFYREELARHGIKLDVRSTSGSEETLQLLADPKSDVLAAFVQGGVEPGDATNVVSLGSLTYTPLWVFYRGEPIDDFAGLRGRRIGIKPEGSAAYSLSMKLLTVSGALDEGTEVVQLARAETARAFLAGEVDAAFFLAPADSESVQRVARTPGVRVLSIARAEAYSRRWPYLKRRTLPQGALDLPTNVPDTDVELLATTAKLVAKDSLHPALAYLLMRAATEIHGKANLLDRAGEFPAAYGGDFELADEAKRYYRSGPPFLQRYLPFWAANLVDRLWMMVVPLVAVVLPLFRAIPPLYRWRVRSRIYRWYARLKEVELQLEENPGKVTLEELLERMETIEAAVNRIQTPLAYSENLYVFRQHIDLVRRRLESKLERVKEEVRKTG